MITLLFSTTLLLQVGITLLCLRMFLCYGRRAAWLFITLTYVFWLVRTSVELHHWQHTEHAQVSAIYLPQMLLSIVCTLFLLVGLTLMQGVYRTNAQAEESLHKEKRQLSMLVDSRVAELETEVSERKRAEEALRQDGERFAAIINTQQEIATADLDLNTIMHLVVERTQTLTHACGAVLEMIDGEALVYRTASGRAEPFVGIRTKRDSGLSGECARSGLILRCNDAENDPRVNLDLCRRTGSRSMIAVPLLYGRQVVGVLQVMSTERFAFSAMDVHTLQLMTGLIAAAMSHAAEFEAKQALLAEAIERAERDPLTGLLNHREFHKRLEACAANAAHEDMPLAVAVMDLDNFKFFNDSYGHITGDDVLRSVAAALKSACRPQDILARFGGDEFAILAPGITVDEAGSFCAHLHASLSEVGFQPPGHDVAIPMSLSVGVAVYPQEGTARLEVVELADTRLRCAKTGGGGSDHSEGLRASLSNSVEGFSMLDALVTAVDNKDRYTHRHCQDVLTYSLEIARELDLDEETQNTISVAALLHDVGKIGVPDHILRKPGRLTDEEFAAVKQHPQMGAVIVSAVPELENTLETILHHHERWDGEGYPYGLQGEMIPVLARLMAVADAFSAMTTDRPYRKGMPQERALSVLREGAGTQWDPKFVQAFLAAHQVDSHLTLLEGKTDKVSLSLAA